MLRESSYFLALSLLLAVHAQASETPKAPKPAHSCSQDTARLIMKLDAFKEGIRNQDFQLVVDGPYTTWIDMDIHFKEAHGYLPQLLGREVVFRYFSPEGESRMVQGIVKQVPFQVPKETDVGFDSSVNVHGIGGQYLIEETETKALIEISPNTDKPLNNRMSFRNYLFSVRVKPIDGRVQTTSEIQYGIGFGDWEEIPGVTGMLENRHNVAFEKFINRRVAFLVKSQDPLAKPYIIVGRLVEVPREIPQAEPQLVPGEDPTNYPAFDGAFGIEVAPGEIERVSHPTNQILDARTSRKG